MSINENPKLESVETLAGEAVIFLRDLITRCQFALGQEPNWPLVFDPPHRRPIDRRCDIEWLISHSQSVERMAMNCNSSAGLETLSDVMGEIDREIRSEIGKLGSLPSRNAHFAESLTEIADCIYSWGKAVNFHARQQLKDIEESTEIPLGLQAISQAQELFLMARAATAQQALSGKQPLGAVTLRAAARAAKGNQLSPPLPGAAKAKGIPDDFGIPETETDISLNRVIEIAQKWKIGGAAKTIRNRATKFFKRREGGSDYNENGRRYIFERSAAIDFLSNLKRTSNRVPD